MIKEMTDRKFEVHFYSPHRNKNYQNITDVFYTETIQEEIGNSEEESKIQSPYWFSLQQIQNKIDS